MKQQEVDISPLFNDLKPFHRLRSEIQIATTDNTYAPKTENVIYDWVNRVAMPAYQAYRGELAAVRRELGSFCTIGTGTGSDALTAIEVLSPRQLVMTDIHDSVVQAAMANVQRNLKPGVPVELHAAVGNICEPLFELGMTFDVIYENLPNLPLAEASELLAGQNSASYYAADGYKDIPSSVHANRLTLHYVALAQARRLLAPHGAVLCSMGARCPTSELLAMVRSAGYKASPLIYTWKMQSEPRDIITGYAQAQQETGRRFVFYRPDALRKAFEGYSPMDAARNHGTIEQQLAPHEIDAVTARAMMESDVPLAHTVMVVKATP